MIDLNLATMAIKGWFAVPRNNLIFGFVSGVVATLIVGAIV